MASGNVRTIGFPPTYILIFLNDSGHIRLALSPIFSLNSNLVGGIGIPSVIEEFATYQEVEEFLSKFTARLRDESVDSIRSSLAK